MRKSEDSNDKSFPNFLTVEEVAEQLRLSPSRVYELIHNRALGHHRMGSARGAIRVAETDLQAFLADSHVERESVIPSTPQRPRKSTLKHVKL